MNRVFTSTSTLKQNDFFKFFFFFTNHSISFIFLSIQVIFNFIVFNFPFWHYWPHSQILILGLIFIWPFHLFQLVHIFNCQSVPSFISLTFFPFDFQIVHFFFHLLIFVLSSYVHQFIITYQCLFVHHCIICLLSCD